MGTVDLRTAKQVEDLWAMREVGFRPIMQCQRCIGGQVIANQCILCGAEHTADGELIEPRVAQGVCYERGMR